MTDFFERAAEAMCIYAMVVAALVWVKDAIFPVQ